MGEKLQTVMKPVRALDLNQTRLLDIKPKLLPGAQLFPSWQNCWGVTLQWCKTSSESLTAEVLSQHLNEMDEALQRVSSELETESFRLLQRQLQYDAEA